MLQSLAIDAPELKYFRPAVTDGLSDTERHLLSRVKSLNMRASQYDITEKCNLRCVGCHFFSSGHDLLGEEKDLGKWREFVDREKARGINYALMYGGEAALHPERVALFYETMEQCCTTSNGSIMLSAEDFPEMRVILSVWGDDATDVRLRGGGRVNVFKKARENYKNDRRAVFLYVVTPECAHEMDAVVRKIIEETGSRVRFQLYTDNEHYGGEYAYVEEQKQKIYDKMVELKERYPMQVIGTNFTHRRLVFHDFLGERWGYNQCPSVSVSSPKNANHPQTRLLGYNHWSANLEDVHRCCTTDVADCNECQEATARWSWIVTRYRQMRKDPVLLRQWIWSAYYFYQMWGYLPWDDESGITMPDPGMVSDDW
jgi:MoaA/NifB/PqqE/SkfB family radical SAM enzyme